MDAKFSPNFQEETVRLTVLKIVHSLILNAHSGLKQFLATESPLKMMKNAFYFTANALSILKIFKFLS